VRSTVETVDIEASRDARTGSPMARKAQRRDRDTDQMGSGAGLTDDEERHVRILVIPAIAIT
jgi:hypothetical protein